MLPVYYITCPELERKRRKWVRVRASHQYVDFRELRFQRFTSPQMRRMFSRLASNIRDALEEIRRTEAT